MHLRPNSSPHLRSRPSRRWSVERLEARQLLAGLPYGALADDTGEYFLGDILVSVVLMESTPTLAPKDVSTENWTPTEIQNVKNKVNEAVAWWKELITREAPDMADQLNFYVDYTYADQPVATGYEPISRTSNDYTFWVTDFLKKVGFNQSADIHTNVRAYNNSKRLAGTAGHPDSLDWAFTIFVPNSTNDPDDAFATGGSFSRAFSFAGGRMAIVPSGRPASTYAHEMGHMFWALDEYSGNSSIARRGYLNVANSNAPHAGYTQLPSIMASGDLLQTAWDTFEQAPSTLGMLGWRDLDGDGVFDVVDVPFDLTGVGSYNPTTGQYRFQGQSSVRTLPNLNPSGLQNDITIARITRAEYRIDGGPWQTAATFDATSVALDLQFPVPSDATLVEIRTIDGEIGAGKSGEGANSPTFRGTLARADATTKPGINGFVWNDLDVDGLFEAIEPGLGGWQVQLVDGQNQPLALVRTFDADQYSPGAVLNSVDANLSLSAIGGGTDGTVLAINSTLATTGTRAFGTFDSNTWNDSTRRLRARFATPTSRVTIDIIGNSAIDYGRLEAYDANDQLLARFTTKPLASGQSETLTIERNTADIAYIIAKGHVGGDVLLDNLKYGPETTTTTGVGGSYQFDGLSAGTYTVRVIPPASFVPSGGLPANQIVQLVGGATESHVDFAAVGVANPWQNAARPLDVNNDGFISPIDALLVINDLNLDGARELPEVGATSPPPFLDVNDDGFVAPLDALMVINYLNSAGNGEGTGGSGGGSTGGASPDGEDPPNQLASVSASTVSPLHRFSARARSRSGLGSGQVDVSDELAIDVYRAWVMSRDALVDDEEAHHHHDDELDEHDDDDHDHTELDEESTLDGLSDSHLA